MPAKKNPSTSSAAPTKAISKGGRPSKKKTPQQRADYNESRRIYKREWARRAREDGRRLKEEAGLPLLLDQFVEQTGHPPLLPGLIQSQPTLSQADSGYGRGRAQSFGVHGGGGHFVCCHCRGINVLSVQAPTLG